MIRKKEIEQLPVMPAKAKGNERYIGRIRVVNDMIVMDIYDGRYLNVPKGEEKPVKILCRWVSDKKNFYTYIFQTGKWTNKGIYFAMHGYAGWGCSVDIPVDDESQIITEKYMEGYKFSGYHYRTDAANILNDMENDIRNKKRKKRQEQRRERIEKRQAQRKPLPKDWDRWLDRNVFKDQRYIFYDSANKRIGKCAHCGKRIDIDGKQRHNQKGKCPQCGSRIVYKAIKITNSMSERRQAVYLQKIENGFMTRYITVEKYSSPDGEKYKSYDTVIATWNGEKTWYDYCVIGLRGEYWDDNRPADLSRWETKGYLYTRNVKRVLEGTIFQYAPLGLLAKHEKGETPVGGFLSKFENSRFLEFMVKAGMWRLAKEYCQAYETWNGRTPREILGVDKQRMKRLIRMNGGKSVLAWLQYEQENNCTISEKEMKWLEANEIYAWSCEEILKSAGSVTRMINYMKKQSIPPRDLTTTWTDYLRLAKAHGLDTSDDIVRFPKDLRLRHDQLVNIENEKKDKERLKEYAQIDQQIKERIPEAARYYWQNDKHIIIPAGTCEELIKEGRSLHHCVGRDDHYMKKMAAGDSWICFLRKKDEIDTPWYTIEIDMKDDHIIQYYSMFDRRPEQEKVQKILKTYLRNVKRNRQRKRVRVAAIA